MSEKENNTKEINQEEIVNEVTEETIVDETTEVTEEPAEIVEQTEEDKYNELNDKYLRIYSEFENYRKRTAKEKLELIGTASEGIMKDLLPVIDDFDRALASNENSEDTEAIKEGINLVSQKFKSILNAKGLKQIEVEQGTAFDVDFHEALTKIPAPAEDLKGKIVDVIEKGYSLQDKVIRYPKVVIGE
jgi:molecular chaperone GrpE